MMNNGVAAHGGKKQAEEIKALTGKLLLHFVQSSWARLCKCSCILFVMLSKAEMFLPKESSAEPCS